MFGYVNIYKPELKVKDYTKYKAFYCGLCKVLQKQYGMLGKMTLSYDMTFLIIFLSSLYESETQQIKSRCMVHPIEQRPMMMNEITEYAASMNIVLMYYKFVDDWNDERKSTAMAGIRALHGAYQQIEDQYPDKCKSIRECLKNLSKAENSGEQSLDLVSRHFGELMSELFVYQHDIWEDEVRRMAFYLGKFIYILDAYDDIEEDIEKNQYNPLKKLYLEQPEDFDKTCEQILTMMMAECTNAYEKLPCVENSELLNNILYVGVWNKYDARLTKRNEQKNQTVWPDYEQQQEVN